MIGQMLGPYRILEKLGEGGMGEVYKARDTRLDRTVAIKVLPPDVSADPDRRARFEREAKTIAGLSHPHICALYDVGHEVPTGGEGVGAAPSGRPIDFLVMEHLAGETLADRLARRKGGSAEGGHPSTALRAGGGPPLRVEEALTIAVDIADALAAAHRQGVIHRDLKPANVMLTRGGADRQGLPHAKLLDFGLAKLTGHGEQPAAASLASAPTRTSPLTSEGTIVGTLQYMAPEQVEGKPADARTDLWALGAILYEMLTGKRAFEGASAASLIGNIMNAEPPPLATLQPVTPPGLDRLVRRCLAKDPENRPDTAHDVADELRWTRETSGAATATTAQPKRRRTLDAALVVAGALALVALGAAAMWLARPAPIPVPITRVSLDVRPADELNAGGFRPVLRGKPAVTPGGSRTALAWTPDGRGLVFVGRRAGVQQLYVRRLGAGDADSLANTEGAQVPAVSADGQWVAFWVGGAIKKVRLDGGPAVDVASDVPSPPCGLAFDESGRLFLGASRGGIRAISPGAAPTEVTTLAETELAHHLPWPLPGGRVILYTVRKRQWSWADEEVVAETLASRVRKVLLRGATDARYLPTGHLVFLRRGVLLAVPFDAERLEVRGTAVPVLDSSVAQALAGYSSNDVTGAGQFAVATTGALAWVPGPVVAYPDAALVTVDRQGRVAPLPSAVASYSSVVRVSPDGRRLAVSIRSLTAFSLRQYDLGRGTLTPLPSRGEPTFPAWSPDGKRLVFSWIADGRATLATQPADGTSPPEVFGSGMFAPASISADGRQVVAVTSPVYDIVTVTAEGGKTRVQPLVQTPNSEGWPAFSPDGRWMAYASDASGRPEVYLRPYPGPGAAEQVSVEGGSSPAWNSNGRELFFVSGADAAGKSRMMAVDLARGPSEAERPRLAGQRVLFEFDNDGLPLSAVPVRAYDVAPGGQRFYAIRWVVPAPAPQVTHISLILNWFEELKAKVPVN
jgi:eukaryotic-like serine/threonine-protein kinase